MALFVLANAAAALSTCYELLLVARVVSALPHGMFFGVGAAIAASLVGEERRASAVAIVFGGLTIAVAAGVPVATVIGQRLGWPMAYWFVAAIGLMSLLAMAATLPRRIDIVPAGSLIEQVKVLGSGRLLIAFGMNFCAWGGTFVAFAYLPSILADITGFGPNGVAWMLALYGVSVIVGNFFGGRVSDKRVVPALALMLGAQSTVLLIFTFTASSMLGSIPDARRARRTHVLQCAWPCALRRTTRPAPSDRHVDIASTLKRVGGQCRYRSGRCRWWLGRGFPSGPRGDAVGRRPHGERRTAADALEWPAGQTLGAGRCNVGRWRPRTLNAGMYRS